MMRCVGCGVEVGVVEVSGPGVGRDMQVEVMCARCYRLPAAQRLATPARPLPGVEQYDSAKVVPRNLAECPHPKRTARFQCMRCLGRSLLCDDCSMKGTCPHCNQAQPKGVTAFVDALAAGLTGDATLTPAEMASEAAALDEHFGDDMKIRIWGNEGRR
jgi:hypothetical protein